MRPFLFGLALVALLVTGMMLSPSVYAADPTPEDKAKAAEFYKEGRALFDKELYSAAIENFKKAHALVPHEANLYNIARAYEKLGDAENCVTGYQAYVDFYKRRNNGQDPKDAIDVRASIQKCQLLQRPKVTINSDPPDAKVYIDDKSKLLGQTPYETTLDPGKYKVYLVLDGFVPFEETLEVRAGEPVNLRFKLEKFQRVGTVRVKSNVRGASLFLDGRNIGLTPYRDPITVDEGAHQISVKKDNYTDFGKEVQVTVNEQTEVTAELYLRDSPATWKAYVGWPTAIVGALGIGFGVFAGTEADKHFKGTPDFDSWSTLQKVGYGAGGGLLGVGILLIILDATDTSLVDSKDELDPYAQVDEVPRVTLVPTVSAPERGSGVMFGADIRF